MSKNKDSSEKAVLKYLTAQNRPYSVNDIVQNLHKEHGKTAVQKALDSLVQKFFVMSVLLLATFLRPELALSVFLQAIIWLCMTGIVIAIGAGHLVDKIHQIVRDAQAAIAAAAQIQQNAIAQPGPGRPAAF